LAVTKQIINRKQKQTIKHWYL